MSRFNRFIRPIVHEERQISKNEVQQENDTREISRIGETETSLHSTSCADSTVIVNRHEKIEVLIIPTEALKKGRHASHVCQHGMI